MPHLRIEVSTELATALDWNQLADNIHTDLIPYFDHKESLTSNASVNRDTSLFDQRSDLSTRNLEQILKDV